MPQRPPRAGVLHFSNVYIQTEQYEQALNMLQDLNKVMPNNQVVALNYANALIKAEKFEQAENLLQDFIILNPESYIAYDLLTEAYEKQKKMAMMHATKAEVFALLGGYSRAVDELQTGYNFAKSKPLVRKRIKARIIQFQDQEDKLKRLN